MHGNVILFLGRGKIRSWASDFCKDKVSIFDNCQYDKAITYHCLILNSFILILYKRSELNQQAENLETEIKQLEERIFNERKEAAKVEEIIENSGKLYTY